MQRIEITKELALTPKESSLLDLHSFLNVMTILHGELMMLRLQAEEGASQPVPPLQESLDVSKRILEALSDLSHVQMYVVDIESYKTLVLDDVAALVARVPGLAGRAEVEKSVDNIASIFGVLTVRVREILARLKAPEAWQPHPIAELHDDMVQVLRAIEKNSKGRYRIAFDPATRGAGDYLVRLHMASPEGAAITMPPVVKDVLRDLVANARKYTDPGGTIHAELVDDGAALQLVVEDTGCGIPAGEVEHVVEYGRRASNVQNRPTKGGGFGLTKAYLVTKQFRGRMWIASEEGVGTRVEITIPHPADEATGEAADAAA